MHTAQQLAFDSHKPFFSILKDRLHIMKYFDIFMTVQREGLHPNFAEFFPINNRLVEGFPLDDKDAVMFVDVGGGREQEIVEFKKRYPDMSGRTILQELPHVIAGAPEIKGKEKMEHDIDMPHPVKGMQEYDQN